MKHLFTTTAALLLMSTAVFAQTATGTGTATSNSSSSSNSGAIAVSQGGSGGSATSGATGGNAQQLQGQSIYVDQRTPGSQRITTDGTQRIITSGQTTTNYRQSGTVRNEFAPAVQAPAMGSGHPCGLSRSVGISIIGGGGSGGATIVDDACLLAQMGKTSAAMAMIAARSPSACAALVASGDISPASNCGDGERRGGGVYARGGSSGPIQRGPNGQPIAVGQNAGNVAPALTAASRNSVCEIKPGTTRTIITSATTQQGRLACAASLGLR